MFFIGEKIGGVVKRQRSYIYSEKRRGGSAFIYW